MVSLPLVSAIVCVRNAGRFLSRALDSILAQDYHPVEILVIDGHSTDDTEAVARKYEPLRFLQQPGEGIADAYNRGIAGAKGPLLAFLSADDEWLPRKLAVQVNFMLENPGVEVTLTHARYIVEPGSSPPPGFRLELLQGAHSGAMETMVARAEVFSRVGGFDTRFRTAEDLDWIARARDGGVRIETLADVLLNKYIHDSNISLTTASNNASILTLLRASLARKRQGGMPQQDQSWRKTDT